jgi:hypothetical protein
MLAGHVSAKFVHLVCNVYFYNRSLSYAQFHCKFANTINITLYESLWFALVGFVFM